MIRVHLRPVTEAIFPEVTALRPAEGQEHLVASTTRSLAQAAANPDLHPFAVYDGAAIGHVQPELPIVGFTMYEIVAGVGFIMRLMIDRRFQRRGYGRATMVEVIRRLRLYPEVQMVATSHLRENAAASALYSSLGFLPWDIAWAAEQPDEIYLHLPPA